MKCRAGRDVETQKSEQVYLCGDYSLQRVVIHSAALFFIEVLEGKQDRKSATFQTRKPRHREMPRSKSLVSNEARTATQIFWPQILELSQCTVPHVSAKQSTQGPKCFWPSPFLSNRSHPQRPACSSLVITAGVPLLHSLYSLKWLGWNENNLEDLQFPGISLKKKKIKGKQQQVVTKQCFN